MAYRCAPQAPLSHVVGRRLDEVRQDPPRQNRRATFVVPPSRVSRTLSRARSARWRRWVLFPKESIGTQLSVRTCQSLAGNGSPRSGRQPGIHESASEVRMRLVANPARLDLELQKATTRSRDSYTLELLVLNAVRWPRPASAAKPRHPGRRSSRTESRRRANPRLSAAAGCPSDPAKVRRSNKLALSTVASASTWQ